MKQTLSAFLRKPSTLTLSLINPLEIVLVEVAVLS